MPDAQPAAVAALRRGRAALRWQALSTRPSAIVLTYHRVTDLAHDPYATAVHPDRFEGHLEILRRNFEPLSLRTVTRSLRDGRLPRRGVVITFDDGYTDNLTRARPLLARFEIPATAFVVSGQVVSTREFWWDELEQILLGEGTLPAELAIELGGGTRRFSLGYDATWSAATRKRYLGWSLRSPDDPTARHTTFRALAGRLRQLPPAEVRRAIDELADWSGLELRARESHATLDPDGLRALAEDDLVEIGAHTASHATLPVLDRDERRREIDRSRAELERWLDRRVRHFAYPYGRASGCADLVRDLGYEGACIARPGIVRRRTDPFRLPRVRVGDWEPAELEARLKASL